MTSHRKRVLFVAPSLDGGGAERVMVILLRHLDRARFEPHLALLQRAGPYLSEVPQDVPIHELKVSRTRYAIPALIQIVWKLRPSAVLSTLREMNLSIILAKLFLPRDTRLLIRETILVSARLSQDSSNPRLWQWLYHHVYVRADKIICLADYMLSDLAENFGVPRQKMTRIYNPVDVDRIRELADAGENPYSGIGPHIVAAGKLSKQKGVDVLLNALAEVRKAIPLAELTILGQGPLESDLKAQRERLGLTEAARFVGFQSNPYPYFKHADVFVLSSRYEGLPNVVLEALALGTPVVATDCPGGVREILAGSRMGWLVPVSNAQLLAERIISVCNFGRDVSLRAEALEGILDKFRVERVIREYEDLLSLETF